MPAEPVEARRPAPNPIAGYEDWPAAVRSAEPWVGADSDGTALGRSFRPGGHAFDAVMQEEAWAFLAEVL